VPTSLCQYSLAISAGINTKFIAYRYANSQPFKNNYLVATELRLPTAKRYELSNHLGNVLTTITGRRLGIAGDGNIWDHYNAERIQSTDYYAYGLELPGRSYNNTAYSTTNSYRYGFNEDRLVLR
jgi:hypothetical protein